MEKMRFEISMPVRKASQESFSQSLRLRNKNCEYILRGLVYAGFLILSGCDSTPVAGTMLPSAVTLHTVGTTPVVDSITKVIPDSEVQDILEAQPNKPYIIGPNDVLSVAVYMHPELSMPPPPSAGGGLPGAMVTGDGTTSLPLVGNVHLGGLTLQDAQNILTDDYAKFIKTPRISVNLITAGSLSYYLLGSFTAPGIKYPIHNMTLLEALALGGSVEMGNADLYQAYVASGTTKLPIDLHALLVNGDLSQNITLASGDTIVIPTAASENAFVFGAVSKPGAVAFQAGALSLLQAIGAAGLDLTAYTNAQLSQVRVIRSGGRKAEFMVVDATSILKGQASSFPLQPGDIVFVPPTAIATWNQALSELLPSLQTVSASLTPFVDIQYLNRH
jgi:polysaccharide export outer membrane protein